MPKDILHYTNGEVTVVWKPAVCIHSTLCWKGLIEVFNPKERPWVKINGADTNRIIEQVRKCPSGALNYFMNDQQAENLPQAVAESANMVKVEVTPAGPYVIDTECLIRHSDGREEIKTGKISLCRCGASHNKPYCDGSHISIGFKE